MSASQVTRSHAAYVRRQLALNWIRLHRPDVAELIELEVEKRFPDLHSNQRGRARQSLPPSLQKVSK